ncbi:D-alanine--poly(phosphoribitol) ligase subunit DltC [Candidatus Binatia bacterium]|nr:D-alanine--poly(phosphoribitol) ligase subunit DltC [Candidatus Binatia bacterium]
MSVQEKTLAILARIAETDEVQKDPALRLFDLAVLDSLKTVELILALSAAFGIEISPAEFDRDEWATPSMIVADVERRVQA